MEVLSLFLYFLVTFNQHFVLTTNPSEQKNEEIKAENDDKHLSIFAQHDVLVQFLYKQAETANEVCEQKLVLKKQPEMEAVLDNMVFPYFNIFSVEDSSISQNYKPVFVEYQKNFYIQLTNEADLHKKIPYYFSLDLYNEIQEYLKSYSMKIYYWEDTETFYGCDKVGIFYGNALYDLKTDIRFCIDHAKNKRYFLIYQETEAGKFNPLKIDTFNAMELFMTSRRLINQVYLTVQNGCKYY